MGLDTNDLLLFAEVIECGSFSLAAKRLELPKSTVSRRIHQLEQHLGERLLQRTTRRLAITDFGEGILAHAQRIRTESEMAWAFAQHRANIPSGLLRVSMPPDLFELGLAPFFLRFLKRYPEVKLELDLSARRVDLLAERFDLAIRAARHLPDDATLVARKLCDIAGGLYASPDYLRRHGVPQKPDDLFEHVALHLAPSDGQALTWQLQCANQHWEGSPTGPLTSNSLGLTRLLLVHGCGIALLGNQMSKPLLEQGALVRVLPDWHSPGTTLWGITPGRRLMPSHTKAFLTLISEYLVSENKN